MLGGYLEFFMNPAIANMYASIKRELDELIQMKVRESFLLLKQIYPYGISLWLPISL